MIMLIIVLLNRYIISTIGFVIGAFIGNLVDGGIGNFYGAIIGLSAGWIVHLIALFSRLGDKLDDKYRNRYFSSLEYKREEKEHFKKYPEHEFGTLSNRELLIILNENLDLFIYDNLMIKEYKNTVYREWRDTSIVVLGVFFVFLMPLLFNTKSDRAYIQEIHQTQQEILQKIEAIVPSENLNDQNNPAPPTTNQNNQNEPQVDRESDSSV